MYLPTLLTLAGLATAAYCRPVTSCSAKWGSETITGSLSATGVCRYTVKYGTSTRWEVSTATSSQSGVNATALPPSCPQPQLGYSGATQSEDCLFATIYAPTTASSLPVLVWFPGGSNIMGGTSAPGLDGSNLAKTGNMVVAVVQSRLGVLGFLPPLQADSASDPNLGLKDAVLALKTIKAKISTLGGNGAKITVGGQSTGAGMVRALLATPTATSLFTKVILQSDPLNYGMSPMRITGELQGEYYAMGALASCSDMTCFKAVSVADLLSAEVTLLTSAPDPSNGVPISPVIRPSYGTSSLPNDPTSSLYYNVGALTITPSSVPMLITNTKDEAGAILAQYYPNPINSNTTDDQLNTALSYMIGNYRANQVANIYNTTYIPFGINDDFRKTLTHVMTDIMWRCPARTLGAKYAAAGGKVYVGEFRQGATYALNAGADICTAAGAVCHQDDIYPTFSTIPSPAGNQSAFEASITGMWGSFVATGVPSSSWAPFTGDAGDSGTGVHALSGDGLVGACPAGFWDDKVKYDWQMFV